VKGEGSGKRGFDQYRLARTEKNYTNPLQKKKPRKELQGKVEKEHEKGNEPPAGTRWLNLKGRLY